MAYPPPVVEAGPRPRPGIVTASVYLLYATAVLLAVFTAISLVYLPGTLRHLDADSTLIANPSGYRTTLITGLVARFAFAVAYALLARSVLRGSQPARITTWSLGGLGALCFGCGLSGRGLVDVAADNSSPLGPVVHIQPVGLENGSIALVAVCLVLVTTAVLLLALPAANWYFHQTKVVAVPS